MSHTPLTITVKTGNKHEFVLCMGSNIIAHVPAYRIASEADALRLKTCWNFFHSEDRHIDTGKIEPGGFWEMVEALKWAGKALSAMWPDYDRGEHGGSPGEWVVETMDQVATLLDRYGAK